MGSGTSGSKREILTAAFGYVHGRGVLFVWEGLDVDEERLVRYLQAVVPGSSRFEILEAHKRVRSLFEAALRIASEPDRRVRNDSTPTADMDALIAELRRECEGFTDEEYRRSMSDAMTHQAF